MSSIYRYFAAASALPTLIVMVMLGYFYHRSAINDLVQIAEDHNVALAKALSSPVWPTISSLLESHAPSKPDPLRTVVVNKEIDEYFRSIAKDISVLKIKLYQLNGRIAYSSNAKDIDHNRMDQPHPEVFTAVAQTGSPRSKLSFKDHFTAFSGETFKRDVVETYVPITDGTSRIVGVFELYSDVTPLKAKVDRTIVSTMVGLLVIFAVFYVILVLGIMRRAIIPLRIASEQAAAVGPQSRGVRLSMEGMASEVQPLIEAVNGALDRLDDALEVQRRFTADAAHELLTPLAVLRANIDTMQDQHVADTLRQDADALSGIVSQLLELAELDGIEQTQDEPINIRDVCVEVVTRIAPLAIKAGKSIALTGTEEPVTVRCPARVLSHTIRNLVENAVAHTPTGTSVEVNVRSDGTIVVTDKGPGVPQSDKTLIFERFWRGKHRTGPGAGLGLSIVKRFAEMSGGDITVEDAPGGGARFILRLPAIKAAQGSPTQHT